MARPYHWMQIDELESRFQTAKTILQKLSQELDFRNTRRAKRLRLEVAEYGKKSPKGKKDCRNDKANN